VIRKLGHNGDDAKHQDDFHSMYSSCFEKNFKILKKTHLPLKTKK